MSIQIPLTMRLFKTLVYSLLTFIRYLETLKGVPKGVAGREPFISNAKKRKVQSCIFLVKRKVADIKSVVALLSLIKSVVELLSLIVPTHIL